MILSSVAGFPETLSPRLTMLLDQNENMGVSMKYYLLFSKPVKDLKVKEKLLNYYIWRRLH